MTNKYTKSALQRDAFIKVSGETYRAQALYLDLKSSFFKRRMKSLLAAGYEIGLKTSRSQQLILT